VPRRVGVMETSNLKAHIVTCVASHKQAQLLESFGITGSSTRLSPEDVREHVALWMAENARPMQTIQDHHVSKCYMCFITDLISFQFRMLINPDTRKHLPHRDTISQDIRCIYEATQQDIIIYLEVSKHYSFYYCYGLNNVHLPENSWDISYCPGLVSNCQWFRLPWHCIVSCRVTTNDSEHPVKRIQWH
jgi:hypothetical protein